MLIVLHRIVQEIETVLGSRQFVEHKDLGNLQYLGQTLKEGLRLHPPVGGTARITTKEENLGGFTIPAGTSINISWFILHRLSDAWSEPEKFKIKNYNSRIFRGGFLPVNRVLVLLKISNAEFFSLMKYVFSQMWQMKNSIVRYFF